MAAANRNVFSKLKIFCSWINRIAKRIQEGSTGKRVGRDLADRNEKVLPSGIFQNSGSHEHSI